MNTIIDKPHSKFRHVYAIVRIDTPFDEKYPSNTLAIVKVLTSKSVAEAEVSRLNQVNADKSCLYVACTSRLID